MNNYEKNVETIASNERLNPPERNKEIENEYCGYCGEPKAWDEPSCEKCLESHNADRPTQSSGIDKLAEALSKAQGEMENAGKDTKNPFFNSKYADLATIISAIKEPLSKNGLSYIQLVNTEKDGTWVDTILMHRSGQSLKSRMKIRPGYYNKDGVFIQKEDMQAIGSAITYARRYALQAIVGLSSEDDDGESAVGRAKPAVSMPQAKQDIKQEKMDSSPISSPIQPISKGHDIDVLAKKAFKARKEWINYLGTEFGCEKVEELTASQKEKCIKNLTEKINAK